MSHRHEGRRRFLALLTVVLATAITLGSVVRADAQTTMRVGVVVDLGNGTVRTIPVTMSGTEATGVQVLQAAGLNPTLKGFGGVGQAVCALTLEGVTLGCAADNSCLTCGGSSYWSYSRAVGGASSFSYSSAGAGATKVHDGDVEGWRWGSGTSPPSTPFATFFPPAPPPATTPPAPTPTPAPAAPGGATTPDATPPPTAAPVAPGAGGSGATPPPTTRTGVTTGAAPPATGILPDATTVPPTTTVTDRTAVAAGVATDSDDDDDAVVSGPPRVEPADGASGVMLGVLALLLLALGGGVVALRLRRRRVQPV